MKPRALLRRKSFLCSDRPESYNRNLIGFVGRLNEERTGPAGRLVKE